MRQLITALAMASTMATPLTAQSIYVRDIVHEENGAIARVPIENRGTGTTTARVTAYTGAPSDTAKHGVDYISIAEQMDVRPGQTVYLDVPILNDNKPGATKTITTKVIVNSGATLRDGTGKITRTDSDVAAPPPPPPPPPAALSVGDVACNEGDVCAPPVTRSGGDLSKGATFNWSTLPGGTAVPGEDYLARSGTLSFAPGSAVATSPTFPSVENTVDAPDKIALVNITSPDAPVAVSQAEVKIVDDDEAPPPPPVPCPDGSTVPAGSVCPLPPPPPPPPADTGLNGNVWVPSPTPAGRIPINLSDGDLTPAPIPGTAAPDVVGAMRFICRAGEIKRNDSLLYWGQPGKAHWHIFYGLSKNEADDTYATMQTKDAYTTCMMPSDDPSNRSAYWTTIPILTLPVGATPPPWAVGMDATLKADLDATGKLTKPRQFFWMIDHFQLYYKRYPESAPQCAETSPWGPKVTGCVQLPHGIDMIFGFNMAEMKDGEVPAIFQCLGGGTAFPSYKGDATQALANCATAWDAGQRKDLRLSIKQIAPGCWDPRFVDSPNHMDHLSYPVQKPGTGRAGCKVPGSGATEVKLIPGLSLLSSYGWNEWVQAAVKADPLKGVRCSSDDHMLATQPELFKACRTFHADVRASWLASVLKRFETCFNKLLNGSAGNMCDGTMMRGGGAPFYKSINATSWAHPTPVVPVRDEGYGADW